NLEQSSDIAPLVPGRPGLAGRVTSFLYRAAGETEQIYTFLRLQAAAEPGDVPLRWGAEMLFVFAAEVRRIFVAHADRGGRGVQILAEHQAACFLEPYLFLELQWAHRRDRLEVMVEARDAHPEFARNIVNFKRLIEVFAETPDRLGYEA